jgi:hypothetical protein
MNSAQKLIIAAVAVALAVVFAGPASAQYYVAHLDGAQEVQNPPVVTPATGLACFTLEDDGVYFYLNYELSFSGLLAAQTAAHIHGPAAVGVNAGILFPFPLGSPIFGTFGPLLPAQVTQLNSQLWYVNVHTTLYPGGEIRGQILPASSPCTVPVAESTWGAVKALYR